jgi:peptidoglycan hydrolase-like protein with peptidoglycan-binding domain
MDWRRRRKVHAAWSAGVALTVAGIAAAGSVGSGSGGAGGSGSNTPDAVHVAPALARITRTTLVRAERVSGTLGYGPEATMLARTGSGPVGTLTWLPDPGTIVRPGRPAYKVDDRPVVLLAGTLPPYRSIGPGVIGSDVQQLEENLAAFGYRGFTVDNRYTAATAAAVRRWQSDLHLARTGRVEVDRVAVAAGALRVTAQRAEVGGPASGPVLSYTRTTRVVTVALDAARQHLVRVGLAAAVTLPDGQTVAGTVTGVGTVATRPTGDPRAATTVDVTVTIADQAKLGALDGAPADLNLVVERHADVLTVPVGALVARAGGGYAVQVVDGTTGRWLPVRAGMFADGRVEVTGDGIAEGMAVGVPA